MAAEGDVQIEVAHTSALDALVLASARTLLDDAFLGDFDGHDWDHALGGMHVLAWSRGELVGHASVVARRLLHGGRALRAGYVEGVGVRADHRRAGIGARLTAVVGELVRGGYGLGALGATDEAERVYAAAGWKRWRGPLSALTPDGVVPCPEERGAVWVLPASVPLDLDAELCCDWRDGDVW